MWEDTDYNPPTEAVYPSTNPYIAYEQERIQKQWQDPPIPETTENKPTIEDKLNVITSKIAQKWIEAD